MKLFGGILVLIMGIIISIVAAWFSVTGMVALFNASAIGVMAMMVSLEAGKLVASGWLKMNWENKNVSLLHRGYLLGAVITLCLITSIGIYGYLSAGHLEQAAPKADIAVQSQPLELQLQQKNDENTRLNQRLNQIDQNIGVFLKNDKATQGLSASKSLQRERDQIQKKIDDNNTAINGLHEKLGPLKMQSNAVEAKLGPVKYVAALFGWEDEESAVRLIILILMCAFDPLAIVLLLSAMTTFRELHEERNPKDEDELPLDKEALLKHFHVKVEDGDDIEEMWKKEGDPFGLESKPIEIKVNPAECYDMSGFDVAPLPKEEEGTKFSPEYSFSTTQSPRSYSVFDWYNRPQGQTPPKEEPTFKVLELPADAGLPTGQLEPEDRADYDLEDEPEAIVEPDNGETGPDPQAVMLDELEQAVKILETDLDHERAAHEDLRTAYNVLTELVGQQKGEKDELLTANVTLTDTVVEQRNQRDELLEKLKAHEADLNAMREAYAGAVRQVAELGEANQDLKAELDQTAIDRDALISILERNPGILNEIEQIVEEDVVEEMSDREKLLDLLEKNPSVINDMAEIIAKSMTKGPGWLDR